MTYCWYCNKTIDVGDTLFTVRKAVVNPDGKWQLMSRVALGKDDELVLLPEDENTETVLLCCVECVRGYFSKEKP